MAAMLLWPLAVWAADDGAPACGGDPVALVTEFYLRIADEATPDSGLPPLQRMPEMSQWLSSGLMEAIERARAWQQSFIDRHPGDKPPWIEGSLFSSNFEGITALESAGGDTDDAVGPGMSVMLRLRYDEGPRSSAVWSDRVILVCDGGYWRIDDVEYGGDWAFGPGRGQRLRRQLDAEAD